MKINNLKNIALLFIAAVLMLGTASAATTSITDGNASLDIWTYGNHDSIQSGFESYFSSSIYDVNNNLLDTSDYWTNIDGRLAVIDRGDYMLISTEYPTSEFSIVFASDRNDGLVKVYVDGDLIEEYNTWANVDLTQPLEYQVIKTLKITGLEYGTHNIKIVAAGDNDEPNDVTIYRYGYNYPEASVPEFPTIALPVAAIIGIAFIFQKKKED
jgi:hypothetical protein